MTNDDIITFAKLCMNWLSFMLLRIRAHGYVFKRKDSEAVSEITTDFSKLLMWFLSDLTLYYELCFGYFQRGSNLHNALVIQTLLQFLDIQLRVFHIATYACTQEKV